MPPRDPMTFPKGEVHLDNLRIVLQDANKRPFIGVTQGGSSRKDPGCRPAATDGRWRPIKKDKF
jgi:hypothetical protein